MGMVFIIDIFTFIQNGNLILFFNRITFVIFFLKAVQFIRVLLTLRYIIVTLFSYFEWKLSKLVYSLRLYKLHFIMKRNPRYFFTFLICIIFFCQNSLFSYLLVQVSFGEQLLQWVSHILVFSLSPRSSARFWVVKVRE